MKYIIGLTGQTGAGKSEFSLIARENGIKIIDCDALYHDMLKKNGALKCALSDAFGDILTNGEIDRKKLSAKAFATADSVSLLNSTVFPFINTEVLSLVNSDGIYLLDAPTLFESGADEICNITVGITAPKSARKSRIMERDSIDENYADMRMSAEKDDTFFTQKCDIIIKNDGTLEDLSIKAATVIRMLIKEANIK